MCSYYYYNNLVADATLPHPAIGGTVITRVVMKLLEIASDTNKNLMDDALIQNLHVQNNKH